MTGSPYQKAKRVVASVQVRMGSSRLPGKTMMPVLDKPLLGHLLDRLERCRLLDGFVVATSVRPENDVIEDYCQVRGVPCFRGSENDVLDRTLRSLQSQDADVGVEVFGDGPLIDPAVVDQIVRIFLDHSERYDFVSNDLKTTYPPGNEVEVFRISTLADSANRAEDPEIRENGTLFIRQSPEIYRLHNVEAPPDLRRPELELEVDTAEDIEVIEAVLRHFARTPDFSLADVITFLDANPAIAEANQKVKRRWKKYQANDLG